MRWKGEEAELSLTRLGDCEREKRMEPSVVEACHPADCKDTDSVSVTTPRGQEKKEDGSRKLALVDFHSPRPFLSPQAAQAAALTQTGPPP
jgi:hypothetical protein